MRNDYRVSLEEFTEEIAVLIKDELVAQFEKGKNLLKVQLQNGQKFCLTVEEMRSEKYRLLV